MKVPNGFPFVSHIWDAYGAPLAAGAPLLKRIREKVAVVRRCSTSCSKPVVKRFVRICTCRNYMEVQVSFSQSNYLS